MDEPWAIQPGEHLVHPRRAVEHRQVGAGQAVGRRLHDRGQDLDEVVAAISSWLPSRSESAA